VDHDSRIKKVVIVGGGTAGWMAAAALGKLFSTREGHSITLIESAAIPTVGVGEATIPPLRDFLKFLGISEKDFMSRSSASYKLAIRFDDWAEKGEHYWHPFGGLGPNVVNWPLYQFWLRDRKDGGTRALQEYSICSQLAQQDRFQFPANEPNSPLRNSSYAYHLDAGRFAVLLREYSEYHKVQRIDATVSDVSQHAETGDIKSVTLDDGREIEGDFFIDCSGFKGLLIEQTLKSGYDDWSEYLPNDSAIAAPTKGDGTFHPYTICTARSAGWQWRIPLQHRTGNGYVYSSKFISDDDAREEFLHSLRDDELIADPKVLRFKGGKRKEIWKNNCLSLGLSSGFLEPLESTSIHLIFTGLFQFLDYFPTKNGCQILRDSFNRNNDRELEEIRDFLILHYCVSNRRDTEYWKHQSNMKLPDSLVEKIELFKRSGRVLNDKGVLFTLTSWISVLDGMGVKNDDYDHLIDAVPKEQSDKIINKIHADIQSVVRMAPRHSDVVLHG